jgi:hypothetical protein
VREELRFRPLTRSSSSICLDFHLYLLAFLPCQPDLSELRDQHSSSAVGFQNLLPLDHIPKSILFFATAAFSHFLTSILAPVSELIAPVLSFS